MTPEKRIIFWKTIAPYLASVFIGLLLAIIINITICPALVNGESMSPTYHDGDILKCTEAFDKTDIHRGDIVVFRQGMRLLIKRVVALPCEEIKCKDGYVYINGEKQTDYVFEAIENAGILEHSVTLQEDEYFCLGDNRNHSSDCRSFGPVKLDQIKKKVVKTLYRKGEKS